MKFLRFLISRTFLKSVAISGSILVVLLILTFQLLKAYTYHGKYIMVPNLEGLSEEQAQKVLESKSMRMDVSDSVYSKRHLPGTVVEQLPKDGAKVKKNRKVFVIVNAKSPEMVLMPDLTDVSLRQARNMIEAAGLEIGDVIYVNSPYKGLVINQYFDNIPIEPGTRIQKNAIVDIEVGKGLSNVRAGIPELKGMSLQEARDAIIRAGMNLGVIVEDHTSKEHTDEAFIWKQRPTPDQGPVRKGTAIDIWMTMDSTLLMSDTTLVSEIQLEEGIESGEDNSTEETL